MITQTHRKAINEALYRRRLRQPYLLRCLPLGQEDTWLPLPPSCRSEVQICVEAAHLHKPVEMADYTTFHPILVSIETDPQGRVMLYKERPNKPSLLWLQWLAPTHKINVLVNLGTMEYLLSTGPKIYIADLDLDSPHLPLARKNVQSKNWLSWFEAAYPELYPNLIGSRA